MQTLFCLGIHYGLHNNSPNLNADDCVLDYLDDIYIVASRDRTRVIYDEIITALRELVGIELNLGKIEAWSLAGGSVLEGISVLNAEGAPPV